MSSIDIKALRARDASLCTCGHKRVSHGSRSRDGHPVAVGMGVCGIDRDTRNALTGYIGDPCPCEHFDEKAALKVVRLTASAFGKRRDAGLVAGTAYVVSDDYSPEAKSYGFTPDGDGVLWFDSLVELRSECG